MPFGRKKTLLDRAQEYVEQVTDTVTDTVIPQVQSALEDAAGKAGPAIADAREKARPLMEEGKTKATEAATAGAAIAAAKAHAGREIATTKVNELRGVEPEPEGGGKLKKLLIVTGLLAIGGVVFSKLRSKDESANWQSSYTPAPPPKPTVGDATIPTEKASPAATPGSATASAGTGSSPDDIGGGDPGEALSDLAEEPHPASTPDAPAEVIDVDDVPSNDRP